MLARDAFGAQGFLDDLQIRHAADYQVVQTSRRPEYCFQHGHGVILERAEAPPAHQCAVEVPEEDAHVREWEMRRIGDGVRISPSPSHPVSPSFLHVASLLNYRQHVTS